MTAPQPPDFHSANGHKRNLSRQLLPRLIIYTLVLLGMFAYLRLKQPRHHATPPRPLTTTPAEISAPKIQGKLAVLLIPSSTTAGQTEEFTAWRQQLSAIYQGEYSVVAAALTPEEALANFQVRQLPALLFFDQNNQEIKRQENFHLSLKP